MMSIMRWFFFQLNVFGMSLIGKLNNPVEMVYKV